MFNKLCSGVQVSAKYLLDLITFIHILFSISPVQAIKMNAQLLTNKNAQL